MNEDLATLEKYKEINLTKNYPKDETFNLTSQIRKSAVSIASNIAEGCGRKTDKDFSNFLSISLGSAFELETQLLISKNLNLINVENHLKLESELIHIQNMLIKLIKNLENKK